MKELLLISLIMLFGCGKDVSVYKNQTPKLDLRVYLNGKTKAWGMLESRGGIMKRRFVVEMETVWNGNSGVLKEKFVFDDGEKSERTWNIAYQDDNNFTATAGDVVGKAFGKQYGNALQMKYVLDLKVGKKNYKVTLDDWMFQLDDKHLVNKSEIKKFEITLARLTIFLKRREVLRRKNSLDYA